MVESSDGMLYGQTIRFIFKMNKQGGDYVVLRRFSTSGTDGSTPSPLLEVSSGLFYGTTQYGGDSAGAVFALTTSPLPPRILSQSPYGATNLLKFGLSVGIPYDLQRSTDLLAWQAVATVVSTSNGNFSLSDTNAPQPCAFYRLRQN